MNPLFAHQKKIIEDDRLWTGIWHGTGGCKTRTTLEMCEGKTLVVCPKTQVLDRIWERENEKWGTDVDLTVISKETFRRDWDILPPCDTFIGDEAHYLFGVSPNVVWRQRRRFPKTSKLYQATLDYLAKHTPKRMYLDTATPDRSPMAIWAAGQILGKKWNFYDFRQEFYHRLPMEGREVYAARRTEVAKQALSVHVNELGYTGRLEDWFDVPEQTYHTDWIITTDEQKKALKMIDAEESNPLVSFGRKDQIENGFLLSDGYTDTVRYKNGKIDKILDYAAEFPQLLIFARYTEQINAIADALRKDKRKVLVLDGRTKDRGTLLEDARNSKECIVVAQSQLSAGYNLPSYPCTIFASLSGSLIDLIQGQGRTQRADNIKKNLYVYLVTKPTSIKVGKKTHYLGNADSARYRTNMNKEDFHEAIYVESQT